MSTAPAPPTVIDPFESLRNWPAFYLSPQLVMDSDRATEQEPQCRICGDFPPPEQLLKLRCDCHYCDGCLERLFTIAMKDEGSYPPRCHRKTISLNLARRHLPKTLARIYRGKTLELSTKDRTYCHKVTCNVFIAPHSIHNGQAFCQKCRSVTCQKCKEAEHFGACASTGFELVRGLARQQKWQQCPDCKRLVEKIDGCNHVLCRCGCDFCYKCGTHLDRCLCEDDDEDDEDEENYFVLPDPPRYRHRRPITPVHRESQDEIIEDSFGLRTDVDFEDNRGVW
ncbi:hypothetical protein AC579_2634 [Pseudocercospora musae]|uniref:RBR-type E3 ubiquitin transferase n=1 Tax=Pseudocercospora musae TaxID=113226 RepID=A0A139IGL0_9PEZI|nr:hypothetical protein AC579_2634 [Pseudocercospora musae]